MTTVIHLKGGAVTVVDDADAAWLLDFHWRVLEMHGRKYAVTYMRNFAGQWRYFYMHRLIAQTPEGMICDHIDNDGLNNQRSNLRNCTVSENLANVPKRATNTAGFKGVSWSKKRRRYEAAVWKEHERYFLGFFNTATEAAKAYDAKALELYGEFARLNFEEDEWKKE